MQYIKNRRTFLLACWALLFTAAWAHAQDTNAIHGEWRGAWYIGMTSGIVTFNFSGEPLRGTMQLTNHEKLGEEAIELSDLQLQGDTLSFRAIGPDGSSLRAKLQVSGAQLKGFAQHAGLAMRLEPERVKAK